MERHRLLGYLQGCGRVVVSGWLQTLCGSFMGLCGVLCGFERLDQAGQTTIGLSLPVIEQTHLVLMLCSHTSLGCRAFPGLASQHLI